MAGNKNSPFFELLRHAKNYFVSSVATKALSLLSVPVMTRLLTPHDYGVLAVFGGYQGLFMNLLTMNCYCALGRYYFEEKEDFPEFFGTSIVLTFGVLSIFTFLFLMLRERLAQAMGLPVTVVLFIVPTVAVFSAASWYEQLYMALRKSRHIALRNIAVAYVTFILSVGLIYSMQNERYLGSLGATLVVGVVSVVYYFRLLRPHIRFSINMAHVRYILAYSLPLLPYTISWALLPQLDRIMINRINGLDHAGLYSFAANIGMLLTLLSGAVLQAWNPEYFKYMNQQDYEKVDREASLVFRLILVFALPLIFFGKELGMVLGAKSYHTSLSIVPIIVIGYIFNAIFGFYGWGIGYVKKNGYLSLIVFCAVILNAALNAVLIPRYGYAAAAYATSVTYLCMSLVCWLVSWKVLKLPTTPVTLLYRELLKMVPFILLYFWMINCSMNLLLEALLKALLAISFALLLFPGFLSRGRSLKSALGLQ